MQVNENALLFPIHPPIHPQCNKGLISLFARGGFTKNPALCIVFRGRGGDRHGSRTVWNDMLEVLRKWRIVHLIGVSALRARYARSTFGQLWITLSSLVNTVVIGVVWAVLWRQPVDAFLPYFGVGMLLFGFVVQVVNDSTSALAGDAAYYMTDRAPFVLSSFVVFYRNVLLFLHQIPLIILLVLWSEAAVFAPSVAYVPAVVLAAVFCLFASYAVAVVCARFRDLIQIVQLVTQNLFLLSPVMWEVAAIPEEYRGWVLYNPFACILETLRNPLLGLPVDDRAYPYLLVWTAVAGVVAKIVHARWNRSIVFWI